MSWDGIMMQLPVDVPLLDLPNDWKVPTIGTPAYVRDQLEQAFPGQQHTHNQTCVTGEMFWVEFNYRGVEGSGLVESIGVRSNAGPGSLTVMKRACDFLDLRMVDCQTSEIADFSDTTEISMEKFTAWRDRVIKPNDENEV